MKLKITARFTGSVLFEHEAENNTIKLTLEAAVKAGANLAGAYLDGANLAGANLAGAYLDGEVINKAPISLLNLQWNVLITSRYMRIGCQRHTHKEWKEFSDIKIKSMSSTALEFWKKWKSTLIALCETYSEEETK